ncbi:MAG: hypothetical protein RIG84_12840 [Roseovarius sp.]
MTCGPEKASCGARLIEAICARGALSEITEGELSLLRDWYETCRDESLRAELLRLLGALGKR